MIKFFRFFLLCSLPGMFIYGQPNYGVDISFLVADFKYSQEHGLKICEVQHGSLSAMGGDLHIAGEDGNISPEFANFFMRFPIKKWGSGLIYPPLKNSLRDKGWQVEQSLRTILNDPLFLRCGSLNPEDPSVIASYGGLLYADFEIVRNFKSYFHTYPGILFVNAAIFPYWNDKYTMNMLFDSKDELRAYKAEWRLYPKKYDPLLSQRIQEEMPSELYVIKPRREGLANGVIVVACSELDAVLHMILEPAGCLKKHPDKKYSYWYKNIDDSFIIEKYYISDYLCFSCPLEEKRDDTNTYHYDATMRVAFIMQYEEEKMTYHSLGGFWKLPAKALEEEGTLNEKRISCCKPPFYSAIDPVLLKEVNIYLERAMLLLYEIMLNKLNS